MLIPNVAYVLISKNLENNGWLVSLRDSQDNMVYEYGRTITPLEQSWKYDSQQSAMRESFRLAKVHGVIRKFN